MQWLRHYDQGVPDTLSPYPERTLLDDLAEAVAERPDAPALLFKGRTVTHGELDRLSDAFAAALAGLGVAQGDRVALLLPNCPQFLIGELGAWKAGAILVPLNPIYTEQELEGALRRTGAETILVLTPFYRRIKAVQPRTALTRVVATNSQGVPAAAAAGAVHPGQGAQGRAPGDPRRRRPVARRPAGPPPGRGPAAGPGGAGRPRGDPDERRHHRHAQRASSASTATTPPPAGSSGPGSRPGPRPGTT